MQDVDVCGHRYSQVRAQGVQAAIVDSEGEGNGQLLIGTPVLLT